VPAGLSLADARRAALSAIGQDASHTPQRADLPVDPATKPPPPVQAPCTPQIAALALCTLPHN
jgi:hypothetical protein